MDKSPWASNGLEPLPEAPAMDVDDVAALVGERVLEQMRQITAEVLSESRLPGTEPGTALLLILRGMIESCTVALRGTGLSMIKDADHAEYEATTKAMLHGMIEEAFDGDGSD